MGAADREFVASKIECAMPVAGGAFRNLTIGIKRRVGKGPDTVLPPIICAS